MPNKDHLASWNEGTAKSAIITFVEKTVAAGVPVEERVATFDADGTLWCEKPLPVEADFVLRALAEQAKDDPTLQDQQPWKAAYGQDHSWLGQAINEHYAGDDTKAKILLGGIGEAFANIKVDDFEAKAAAFLNSAQNGKLGRRYVDAVYVPMLELLAYLADNGFTNHVVSGSGGDFMRPGSLRTFGIPLERVIGSQSVLEYKDGDVTRKGDLGFLDDGPRKPVQIWTHVGRRPLVAGGNSNGDLPMLEFAQHQDTPSLCLLVLHDDADREFAYTSGAEKALANAETNGWTVVSMKNDFATIFTPIDANATDF